jgi:hypothetical protein
MALLYQTTVNVYDTKANREYIKVWFLTAKYKNVYLYKRKDIKRKENKNSHCKKNVIFSLCFPCSRHNASDYIYDIRKIARTKIES